MYNKRCKQKQMRKDSDMTEKNFNNPLDVLGKVQMTIMDEEYNPIYFDVETFNKGVGMALQRYGAVDLSVMDIKDVEHAQTEINRLIDKLETRRKTIKHEFMKPYESMNAEYQLGLKELKGLSESIKSQIDDYKGHQKLLRLDTIRAYIQPIVEEAGLQMQDFEEEISKYTRKSDFKSNSFTLKKQTEKKLKALLAEKIQEATRKDKDQKTIHTVAEANGLLPDNYLRLFEKGTELSELVAMMTKDAAKSKELETKRAALQEIQAKRQAEMEQMAKELGVKLIDTSTGEIFDMEEVDESVFVSDIRVWFTKDQANKLKAFMEAEGIKHETLVKAQEAS